MHALFRFQIAVGVFALDLEIHALDARLVAVQTVEFHDLETVLFGITAVHTVQHGYPVAAFRAARTRMQRQKRVIVVVFAAEKGADTHFLDVRLGGGDQSVQFRHKFLFARLLNEVDDFVHVVDGLFALFVGGDPGLHGRYFAPYFFGSFQILPNFGIFLLGFERGKLRSKPPDIQRLGSFFQRGAQRLDLQSVIVRFKHIYQSFQIFYSNRL